MASAIWSLKYINFLNDPLHFISKMRVLILIAHSDTKGKSHAHQVAEASKQALTEAGHEVRVVDLVRCGFDKCLREEDFVKIHDKSRFNCYSEFRRNNQSKEIEEQCDNLDWATHVIACGPMWWLNFPAVFYAWMEKVLCATAVRNPNSSYYDNGPNRGKKIMLCITTGSPNANFSHGSNLTSVDGIFYQTLAGLYAAGFSVMRSQPFFCAMGMSESEFGRVLKEWKKRVIEIDSREVLNFHRSGLNEQGLDGCQQICALQNPLLD
ncbi:Flavodoxin-like fold family protein [Tritrichomonas foetus]|uniref:Flavodoxin-like fold family protein n=1 Tax=Tritrichomonas foetus TaxID=1144522 RepID=A0A1J4KA84_9EUKA|nr:Flavodoxin-like fold family protein [Tritrichomonas foetus]|eukprot:OHT08335.1 Flavodoxin-like fold family protein [Tritrichomonas foetus]